MEIEGFSTEALRALRSSLRPDPVTPAGPSTMVDLTPMVDAIARMSSQIVDRLDTLVDAVTNPTATTGAELFRRGVLAYSNGWFDEARADLERSIEAYPYRAGPHLFLGLTLLRLGTTTEAMHALTSAVKYGSGGDASSAVTAAIIADRLAVAAGVPESGKSLLSEADSSLPLSYDLQLAFLSSHGSTIHVQSTVRAALVLQLDLSPEERKPLRDQCRLLRAQWQADADLLVKMNSAITVLWPRATHLKPTEAPTGDDYEWCSWLARCTRSLHDFCRGSLQPFFSDDIARNDLLGHRVCAEAIETCKKQIAAAQQFIDTSPRAHDARVARRDRRYRGRDGHAAWAQDVESRREEICALEDRIVSIQYLESNIWPLTKRLVASVPWPGSVPVVSTLPGFNVSEATGDA